MTDVAFKPLTQIELIFRDLVWRPMIKAGEVWIEGNVPILAFPGIKQISEELVEQLADWTFEQIRMFIDIAAIKLVSSAHQSAYDQASLELRIIAINKGIDSQEFKNARDKALEDLSRFTNLAGGQ